MKKLLATMNAMPYSAVEDVSAGDEEDAMQDARLPEQRSLQYVARPAKPRPEA